MKKYFDSVQDQYGNAVSGATVTVYNYGTTTKASLYSDSAGSSPISNPLTTASTGYFEFYADNGRYTLSIVSQNTLGKQITDVLIQDTTSLYSASSGSSLVGYTQGGTGAVATTVQSKLRESVSVLDFGADPTGVSDSTTAIQSAATYATSIGARLIGTPGTFLVSSTLSINCNGDLSPMTLTAHGNTMTGPVIRVGTTGSTTEISQIDLKLPKVSNLDKSANTWTGAGSYSGVEIAGLYQSKIQFNYVQGFLVGFDLGGYSNGCGLNTFEMQAYGQNNKIGLRLQPKASAGYVNENVFIGVNLRIDSGHGTAVAGTRNIQILPYDITNTATSWPNNNVFLKPDVEGDAPEYHIEIAGADNLIISPRTETIGTTQKILFTGNAGSLKTTRNLIQGGFNPVGIVLSKSGVCQGNGMLSSGRNIHDSTQSYPLLTLAQQASSNDAVEMVLASGQDPLAVTNASTNWRVSRSANYTDYKATADAYARLRIDHQQGLIMFGDGTALPTKYLEWRLSNIGCAANYYPDTDNTYNLGASTLRWAQAYAGYLNVSVAAPTAAAGSVNIGGTTASTVGAAGGASALPATPLGYLIINVAGTAAKIPYYNN